MSVHQQSFQFGTHSVTIETGELARQADGAVIVRMADTVVLVTAASVIAMACTLRDRAPPPSDRPGRLRPRIRPAPFAANRRS